MGIETDLSRLIAAQAAIAELIAGAGSIPVTIHLDGCEPITRELETALAGI